VTQCVTQTFFHCDIVNLVLSPHEKWRSSYFLFKPNVSLLLQFNSLYSRAALTDHAPNDRLKKQRENTHARLYWHPSSNNLPERR